ncbi:MAG: hypothetical protein JW781_00360 [Deltaproteobacteria bacterium]|nr:hypothetical protein [Candidatus Anaeroferrophillacea bacterium]
MVDTLLTLVRREAGKPVPAAVQTIAEAARKRHRTAVTAVIHYGSCLRRPESVAAGIIDLYLLVDSYRAAGLGPVSAGACRLLPPNVYYLETEHDGVAVRTKYALMHRDDFFRGTRHWFHAYIWARFAQPCRLVWAADEAERNVVAAALAEAVQRFIREVQPLMKGPFSARELWLAGFGLSYGTELRSETTDRGAELYAAAADYYAGAARAVLGPPLPAAAGEEPRHTVPARGPIAASRRRIAWFLRRRQSKVLSVLRLLKAAFTFTDGPAYLIWKIRRHNPDIIAADDPRLQRPVTALAVLIWRLVRRRPRC